MRASFIAASVAALLTLVGSEARANNGGLPGYTGKPTALSPQGESCNQCHTGGTAPTLAINGPASLAAGQSAEYTLVVTTGALRTGAGVAGSEGVVLTPGTGFRASFGEMVQNAPLAPTGGAATYRFTVKAPATGTTLKLWAVGLAANNSGSTAGDRAAHTTRDIMITGGGTTPPPPTDAGTGTGTADAGSGTGTADSGAGTGTATGTGTGTGTGDGTGAGDGTGGGDEGDEANAASPDEGDDGTPAGTSTAGSGRNRRSNTNTGAACASSPLSIDTDGFAAVLGMMTIGMVIARRRKRG